MADPTPLPLDYSAARDQIEAALKAELSRLLDGTVDQVDGPVRDAANRLIVAARRGDRALADECRDQLVLELERARMSARSGMESALSVILGRGIGLLFDGLVAGLSGIRVPR